LSPWLRSSLYWTLSALWLTGCAWLILHLFFQTTTEFGTTPHPWQPMLLLVHAVVAVVVVFLFGWVAGTHIETRWRRGINRASGIALMALASVLVLTGFGNYYLTGEWLRAATAVMHETLGALAILPALVHWLSAKNGAKNGWSLSGQ
jgi:hypothetical protein